MKALQMKSGFFIRRAAVLGAGVMGAQIAAHLANAGVQTLLFELPAEGSLRSGGEPTGVLLAGAAEGDSNANVVKALDDLKNLDPAPLASPAKLAIIQPANYADHLDKLRGCDLVIEAIAEKLEWKSDLYRKVAPYLGERAIFASNTSGLSINTLAQSFPEQLRHRFCGIHFFNPPRYMHLVELIASRDTEAAMLDQLETFLVSSLGKGVVRAKDTPSFIANRIGVFSMRATQYHAQAFGLSFDTVDALTGRYLGRPKSATFRTLDVVGLDIFAHVVAMMRETLRDDPWHAMFALPDWFERLVAEGALGQKSKRGVYLKVGKEIHVLDRHSGEYRLSVSKAADEVQDILRERDWARKLSALRASNHPQAQFLWAVFRDVFHYCAWQLEHIADNARDLDFAMRWGFGWDRGPFEIWQAAGWQQVAGWITEDIAAGRALANVPLPDWALETGRTGVHTQEGSYAPADASQQPRSTLPVYRRQLFPAQLYGETSQYGETIFETEDARLWHMGDDIAILSFHSKMHTIGSGVLDAIQRAVDEAEAHFSGLVIWQAEPPFSVGANLLQVMQGVREDPPEAGLFGKLKQVASRVKYTVAGGGGVGEMLDAAVGNVPRVEEVVAQFQRTTMRLKYAQVPVIAAVDGLAMGGGCEVAIHCARIVATLESYIGLVEIGVGLLPAGGGCKEMALRAAQAAQGGDVFHFLKRNFTQIAMSDVSKSAEMARELGYLRPGDHIVMNRYELLHVAKQEIAALAATAYRPPQAELFPVAGRSALATLKVGIVNMLEGGFISEHDHDIASRIAEVMCGGDVDAGTRVDEQWLLDLERRHFMELLATNKTQARIEHMLKHSKPLRN